MIDINANKNDLNFPINVLGLQTDKVSALNGNLAGNAASNGARGPDPARQPAPPAPALASLPDAQGVTAVLQKLTEAVSGLAGALFSSGTPPRRS